MEIKFGTTYESYESEENDPNIAFVNTHAQLEALRDEALLKQINGDESGEGPRVLIAGPADSGKTSLAKILIAYGALFRVRGKILFIAFENTLVCVLTLPLIF